MSAVCADGVVVDSGDDPVAKCKAYQEQRSKAKAKRLYGVTATGVTLMASGAACQVVGIMLHAFVAAIGILAFQAGLCLCASCPSSDVNLNRMLKRRWFVRVAFALACSIHAYVETAGSIISFAPSGILYLWLAMNHRGETVTLDLQRSILWDLCRWPDSTTLLIFSLVAHACGISTTKSGMLPAAPIAFVFSAAWLAMRTRYRRSGGERGVDPTLRVYFFIFALFAILGSFMVFTGLLSGDYWWGLFGLCNITGPLVLFGLGRERLFHLCARQFENSQASADGAMMAELIACKREIQPGMMRWVHRPAPDEAFDYFDPNRNWQKGVIIQITEEDLAVELVDGQVERIPHAHSAISAGELLEIARRDFRGIPWSNFSRELMMNQTSAGSASPDDLTIPMGTTSPDFFLSHSWHDSPRTKYDEIAKFSNDFYAKHGRQPVFWLDKVCINQDRIADGLKALPINVMTCKKILAVCGETYLNRLWCVLELCTLLSFMNESEAAERVEFRLLPGSSKSEQEVLDDILNFDVAKARCYDPNEQEHLMHVISGLGFDHMNAKMRRLGAALKKKASLQSQDAASHTNIGMPPDAVIDVGTSESSWQENSPCTPDKIWI